MARHTVGYAVGLVTLPVVLVLSMTTALVMGATRTLPLPVVHALGCREAFAMEAAGGPLRLTGRIIRDREVRY